MDWKAQFHFILLGLFSVIGIALLVVALMGKSGASTNLLKAKGDLDKAASTKGQILPSQADVTWASNRKGTFETEVNKFGDELKNNVGQRLLTFPVIGEKPDRFYSDEVVPCLDQYKARLMALAKAPQPPLALRKAEGKENPNAKVLSTILDDSTNNPFNPLKFFEQYKDSHKQVPEAAIPLARAELKVMNEIICTLEKLRADPAFKDSPFIFERFDFSPFAGAAANKDVNSPWVAHEFSVLVHCEPTFALTFAEELTSPSERTQGTTVELQGAYKDKGKRDNLPMELVMMTGEAVARPIETAYFITNEARPTFGIDTNKTPDEFNKDTGKKQEIQDQLAADQALPMPMRYTLRLNALERNTLWTITATK